MPHTTQYKKSVGFVLSLGFLVSTLAAPLTGVQAVGPTGPVSPQTPTGPQGQVGPKGPVGPQTPTGPQGTVGPRSAEEQAAAAARALEIAQANSGTGSNSENTNSTDTASSTQTAETNNAQIGNTVRADLNTGDNSAKQNTKVGSVTSGNIQGSVNIVNIANSQFAAGSSVGSQSVSSGAAQNINLAPTTTNRQNLNSNNQTGENSVNLNSATNSDIVDYTKINRAAAANDVQVTADTGNNAINQNTTAGSLVTGDVALAVNLINILNAQMPDTQLDLDIWTVLSQNPDAIISLPATSSNSVTGANSENLNVTKDTRQTGITVTQTADTTNDLAINANTGNNEVSKNTLGGDLKSGTVTTSGAVTNLSNVGIPNFYILNVFGDWNGSLQGVPAGNYYINRVGNDTTGANSSNQNTDTSHSDLTGTVNNQATASNKLLVDANTGNNSVSQNSSVGSIQTGNVHVAANVVNLLNTWATDLPNFRLGVINLFSQQPEVTVSTPATPTKSTVPDVAKTSTVAVGGKTVATQKSPVSAVTPVKSITNLASVVPINATTATPLGAQTLNPSQYVVSSDSATSPKIKVSEKNTEKVTESTRSFASVAQAADGSSDDSGKMPTVILLVGGLALLAWAAIEVLARSAKN